MKALATLMFIFTLAGCGGASFSFGAVYFPINVGDVRAFQRNGTQGLVNFTQTVQAQTSVNGNSVFPFLTADSQGSTTRIDYFAPDTNDGVRICGWEDQENAASSQYSPCVFLPFLSAGETFSDSVQVAGGGTLANAVTFDYVFRVVSFSEVTVPAGTFQNCAINTIDAVNLDATGDIVDQGLVTISLCPGAGITEITTESFSFGGANSVLTSATVGGSGFPTN